MALFMFAAEGYQNSPAEFLTVGRLIIFYDAFITFPPYSVSCTNHFIILPAGLMTISISWTVNRSTRCSRIQVPSRKWQQIWMMYLIQCHYYVPRCRFNDHPGIELLPPLFDFDQCNEDHTTPDNAKYRRRQVAADLLEAKKKIQSEWRRLIAARQFRASRRTAGTDGKERATISRSDK